MNNIAEWLRRLWYLVNRTRLDEELRREMEAHRAMMKTPARFGNTLRLREEARDVWGWRWLDDLGRDLRFAVRTFRRAPGFTAIAVFSLALATGATTAIFGIVESILLRPLPFADADRLVQVYGRNWREDRGGVPDPLTGPVAAPALYAYQTEGTSFEGFAAYHVTTKHLETPAGSERLMAVGADSNFFEVLGVEPLAGRVFRRGDSTDVAVISARLWAQRFGTDRSLPGRTVLLNGQPFSVVGIMPESFQFPYSAASLLPGALPETRTDVWVPIEPIRDTSGRFRRGRTDVVAKLKRGISTAAAAAELRVIAGRLEQSERSNGRVGVRLEALATSVTGPIAGSLWMLFAAAGLVLVAACANVANLLLARMTVRTHEVVTRAAIGAGTARLARQFLAESLLLSIAGSAAGILVARWAAGFLTTLASAKLPRAHEVALDWQAFVFLSIVCLAAAVAFGVAPALAAARIDPMLATKWTSGGSGPRRSYPRLRNGLAIAEVGLAVLLAIGAAALIREVLRLQHVDTGMTTANVLTLHLTPAVSAAEYYAIEERVTRLPGVQAAGLSQLVPLQNWGWTGDFEIRGRTVDGRPTAGLRYVTPGYFNALEIPLRSGRFLAGSDTANARRVIVVNDALARQHFSDEDPVGRELDRGTIVGVVGSVRQVALHRPAEPEIFYPAAQNLATVSDIGMSLIVRTAGNPVSQVSAIRAAVRDVNPRLAIFNIKTMDEVVADSLWDLNLYRWLIVVFATLAVAVAGIGLHGVVSFSASSRTREFAVRLALGSEPRAVARLVLAGATTLTAAGLVIGIASSLALTLVLDRWSVRLPADLLVYVAVTAFFVALAFLACLAPAMRVMRLMPANALRAE